MNKPKVTEFFATLFYSGKIKFMPGTMGTLLTFLLLRLVVHYNLVPWYIFRSWWYVGFALLFVVPAVYVSHKAEKKLGHDHPSIVIDEAAGLFFATAWMFPLFLMQLYAFILFRCFDIAKPWPCNILQKLPGGFGIVADDLMAGLYANLCVQLLSYKFPAFFGLPTNLNFL